MRTEAASRSEPSLGGATDRQGAASSCEDTSPRLEVLAPIVGTSCTQIVGASCPPTMSAAGFCMDRFRKVSRLGSGVGGTVFLAMDAVSRQQVALKVYKKKDLSPPLIQSVRSEVRIHARLRHPHIVPFYAAFEDETHVCVVTKAAQDYDLFQRMSDIRRDERTVVKHVVGPLLSALSTMHLAGIIHRDVKPENVLLQGSHVLLADFGFALAGRERALTLLGTLSFMAPELMVHVDRDSGHATLRSEVPRDRRAPYGEEVDVWALGVLTFECLLGRLPFAGSSYRQVLDSISGDPIRLDGQLSHEAIDFLRQCFTFNASDRPHATELFAHPWITNHIPASVWAYLHPTKWAPIFVADDKGRPSAALSTDTTLTTAPVSPCPGRVPSRLHMVVTGSPNHSAPGPGADDTNVPSRPFPVASHSLQLFPISHDPSSYDAQAQPSPTTAADPSRPFLPNKDAPSPRVRVSAAHRRWAGRGVAVVPAPRLHDEAGVAPAQEGRIHGARGAQAACGLDGGVASARRSGAVPSACNSAHSVGVGALAALAAQPATSLAGKPSVGEAISGLTIPWGARSTRGRGLPVTASAPSLAGDGSGKWARYQSRTRRTASGEEEEEEGSTVRSVAESVKAAARRVLFCGAL